MRTSGSYCAWTADTDPSKQVGLVLAGIHPTGIVKHLADLDNATEQLVSGGPDIRDDQIQALCGAGRAATTFLPKMIDAIQCLS
jgi:hypothetical protein